MRQFSGQRFLGAARTGRAVSAILSCVVLAWGGGMARADQWSIAGQLSERLLFDSNFRLTETDPQSVFGSITSLRADAAVTTPRAEARISGHGIVARYTEDPTLNSEDLGLAVRSLYRFRRSVLGLDASLRRASTLFTEETDAGNFTQTANQIAIALRPSWEYQVSSVDAVSVTGSWADVSYDSPSFVDSTSYAASVSWLRRLSPVETLSFGARATYIVSRREFDTTRTQSYAAFVAWSISFTPRLSFAASAGPRLTFAAISNGGSDADDDVDLGADVDLRLTWRASERTVLTIAAAQNIEPSSAGGVQERQRLSFGLDHRLSPRWLTSLSGSFQHNRGNVGRTIGGDSDRRYYFAALATTAYRITPTLSVGGQYQFRAQSRDLADSFAFSHGVAVMLTYSPREWRFGN